jgi:citrate synthase
MKDDLSAKEAANILDVSLATLYSYVSRGLVSSRKTSTSHKKTYNREEITHLAARRSDAKHGGHRAASAINWGIPLLETSISYIADGQLFYRGYQATALAQKASLEEISCLLWDDQKIDYFSESSAVQTINEVDTTIALATLVALQQVSEKAAAPLERAMVLAPALLHAVVHEHRCDPAQAANELQIAPRLMRQIGAILLNQAVSDLPLHLQIARAWKCTAIETELIRASLVLLADHELNTSTFAVRCVASTGANLAAGLYAGLSALSGPKHGGGSRLAKQYLIGAQACSNIDEFTRQYFENLTAGLAGFGHMLYPNGDPRATYLLQNLRKIAEKDKKLRSLLDICTTAEKILTTAPNVDLVLALMELHYAWPESAAINLFAIARCAGWIAHAHEQAEKGTIIRPRARYIGKYRFENSPQS